MPGGTHRPPTRKDGVDEMIDAQLAPPPVAASRGPAPAGGTGGEDAPGHASSRPDELRGGTRPPLGSSDLGRDRHGQTEGCSRTPVRGAAHRGRRRSRHLEADHGRRWRRGGDRERDRRRRAGRRGRRRSRGGDRSPRLRSWPPPRPDRGRPAPAGDPRPRCRRRSTPPAAVVPVPPVQRPRPSSGGDPGTGRGDAPASLVAEGATDGAAAAPAATPSATSRDHRDGSRRHGVPDAHPHAPADRGGDPGRRPAPAAPAVPAPATGDAGGPGRAARLPRRRTTPRPRLSEGHGRAGPAPAHRPAAGRRHGPAGRPPPSSTGSRAS